MTAAPQPDPASPCVGPLDAGAAVLGVVVSGDGSGGVGVSEDGVGDSVAGGGGVGVFEDSAGLFEDAVGVFADGVFGSGVGSVGSPGSQRASMKHFLASSGQSLHGGPTL